MKLKKEHYWGFCLFFLALFQYMPIEEFLGIDFLFLGLLFSAYFLETALVLIFALIIVILNWLITREVCLFSSVFYIFLPFLAQKIKTMLDLNFKRYFELGLVVLCVYVCVGLAGLKLLGIKNFSIFIIRNAIAAFVIYTVIRLTFISQFSSAKEVI